MRDLNKDLSIITGTSADTFSKLSANSGYLICNYLEDMILNNEDSCSIDLGIGVLNIKLNGDELRYSFIPSTELEGAIINTLENNQAPLISVVTGKLVGQLNKLYDNLL